ncbi:hypothetical protein [Lysobacter gummosus]|uniref:hypothetical protein n=1 Tax=Lysobacter gummosus TaxID=262324 RepID=UPI003634B846
MRARKPRTAALTPPQRLHRPDPPPNCPTLPFRTQPSPCPSTPSSAAPAATASTACRSCPTPTPPSAPNAAPRRSAAS